MLTRRQLFHTGLVSGCAACSALATSRLFAASAMDASAPSKIEGRGYSLSYLGSQRQTILTGDRAAHLDLRTESYETGVPFFVWAEVSAWQTQEMPDGLRTYAELERFVGQAGAKAELTQAFPFVITGRAELIDFHIVNATLDTPPGMEAHQKIQVPFELHGQDVKFVGFWSSQHQGVFTPMGTNMHAHFQTPDNKVSGHVQGLKLAHGLTLSLPKG
jgi:Alpha-acetolactate decarboxylase